MPKKEKVWTMGIKGPIGPWAWSVWVKGKKKPIRMMAFDIKHLNDQLEGQKIVKAKKLPEEKNDFIRILMKANYYFSTESTED